MGKLFFNKCLKLSYVAQCLRNYADVFCYRVPKNIYKQPLVARQLRSKQNEALYMTQCIKKIRIINQCPKMKPSNAQLKS